MQAVPSRFIISKANHSRQHLHIVVLRLLFTPFSSQNSV